MDYFVYNYDEFICTYEDYSNKYCSYQQYLDYKNEYFNEFKYYGGNLKRIDISARFHSLGEDDNTDNNNEEINFFFEDIHGISFLQFWCGIGKYDSPLLLSLGIVMIIFIIVLIIDLCIKKDNISNGVLYYIILFFYMI